MNSYPYANGVLAALETKILDKTKLYILKDYQNDEFIKVLTSMNYGGYANSLSDVIEIENQKTKELLNEISPKKSDTDLFFLVNDTEVLKVLYKIRLFTSGEVTEKTFENYTTFDYDALKKAIFEHDLSSLKTDLKEVIKKIEEKITSDISPKNLSSLIDEVMYAYAKGVTNDKILKKYLELKIDLTNLEIYFRCRKLSFDNIELEKVLIEGGLIKKKIFVNNYQEPLSLVKALNPYYNEAISKVLSDLLLKNNLKDLSIKLLKLLQEKMNSDSLDPNSIGPVINYYLKKEIEAQNIKLLYKFKKIDINELI